jgi:hypothetical protein
MLSAMADITKGRWKKYRQILPHLTMACLGNLRAYQVKYVLDAQVDFLGLGILQYNILLVSY